MTTDPICDYLDRQRLGILAGDRVLRVDCRADEEVIHQTRVAVRRMRSTIRTFAPYVEHERARNLDTELRWYAALLGEVRDLQVLTSRLHALLDSLDEDQIVGPVAARVDLELAALSSRAEARLHAALTTARYRRLLTEVESVIRHPARVIGKRGITTLTGRAGRQVTKRLARAGGTEDPTVLHRVRKAAKRARYAAELAEPVIGLEKARAQAAYYERLQDLLGEHRDARASASFLRGLAQRMSAIPGESGFTLGVLYERERHAAQQAVAQVRRLHP